jgi:hypothetical protein
MITPAAEPPAREALLSEPACQSGKDASPASEQQLRTSTARKPDDEDFAPQPLPPRDPEMAARYDVWWDGMLPEERKLLEAMVQADKVDSQHDR